jgi:hypothetical protein
MRSFHFKISLSGCESYLEPRNALAQSGQNPRSYRLAGIVDNSETTASVAKAKADVGGNPVGFQRQISNDAGSMGSASAPAAAASASPVDSGAGIESNGK